MCHGLCKASLDSQLDDTTLFVPCVSACHELLLFARPQGHEAHAATSMEHSTYEEHSSVTCGKAQHCKASRLQRVRNVVTMDVPHLSLGIEVLENSVFRKRGGRRGNKMSERPHV